MPVRFRVDFGFECFIFNSPCRLLLKGSSLLKSLIKLSFCWVCLFFLSSPALASDLDLTTDFSVFQPISRQSDLLTRISRFGHMGVGDLWHQRSIRGGKFSEFKAYIDGVPVGDPYFLGGRLSFFPDQIEAQSRMSYWGGSARYGRVLSGFIDFNLPSNDILASQSLFSMDFNSLYWRTQAPIELYKSSYFISFRRSVEDVFSGFSTKEDSKANFQSLIAKYINHGDPDFQWDFSVYFFQDSLVSPRDLADFGKIFLDSESRQKLIILSSHLDFDLFGQENNLILAYKDRELSDNKESGFTTDLLKQESGMYIKNEMQLPISESHHWVLGLEYEQILNSYSMTQSHPVGSTFLQATSININVSPVFSSIYLAGYLTDQWTVSARSFVEIGVRVESYQLSEFDAMLYFLPRIEWHYDWSDTMASSVFYGVYRQDSVLFNAGYFAGSTYVYGLADLKPEAVIHYGISGTYKPDASTLLEAAIFYKKYENLVKEEGVFPLTYYSNSSSGKALGGEIQVEKTFFDSLKIQSGYSYTRSLRTDSLGSYYTPFEFRHQGQFNAAYNVSEYDTFGLAVAYRKGTLYTPIEDYSGPSYAYGKRYSKRMPDYFRVDVSYQYLGGLILPLPILFVSDYRFLGILPILRVDGKTWMGIQNVFDRQNSISYNWDFGRRSSYFVYDSQRTFVIGYELFF